MADQFAALNSQQASRNRGGDQRVGGSASFNLPGPKAKSFPNANDAAALKKVAAGRPDTAKKSKRVG